MPSHYSLENEVALVTGASRGIGRACAIALARSGAQVLVNFVANSAKAEEVCHEITRAGGRAMPAKFDVADELSTKSAIEDLIKETKTISILVNNAGVARDGLMLRYAITDWDAVVNTSLRGAFICSQAVLRPMIKQRKGSIIHISSIVGLTGNAGQTAYCAAKAGLIGLTKSMARELAVRNIRVNAVAPGYIATDMTDELNDEQKTQAAAAIPLGRIGQPEEIADTVVFLASEQSQYITGQTFVVDGGMSL